MTETPDLMRSLVESLEGEPGPHLTELGRYRYALEKLATDEINFNTEEATLYHMEVVALARRALEG